LGKLNGGNQSIENAGGNSRASWNPKKFKSVDSGCRNFGAHPLPLNTQSKALWVALRMQPISSNTICAATKARNDCQKIQVPIFQLELTNKPIDHAEGSLKW